VDGSDEIGKMAQAFRAMIAYLRTMTAAAERIADGDLTATIQPASERDALGTAYVRMVDNLRTLVREAGGSAAGMSSASKEMASSSEQTGRAVEEISGALSSVAHGADRQLQMIDEARESALTASDVARAARGVADDGVVAVRHASEAMQGLL